MEITLKKKNKDTWSNVIKYKNCFDYISPYWTRSGSIYTGLTPEDERRLEKALGYQEGHLARSSSFWVNFCVKLGAEDKILHTENAWDELQYLFLKDHKRVATTLSAVKPATDYILINKEAEAIESNKISKLRRQAIKEFDKLSLDEMRKCLRLYGYKSESMSAELVEQKLFQEVEKMPQRFFDKWINNKTRAIESTIEQAIAKNIMRKSRNNYYYGTDLIGTSMSDVVSYLENPANQDLKLSILQEIESK